MKKPWFTNVIHHSLLSLGLLLACGQTALAQAVLTHADLNQVQNQVSLDRQNRGGWQPAKRGDRMVPQDALQTGANSRAELVFNEGTLVRTGAGTTFRFPTGRRVMEVVNGSTLIVIPPGSRSTAKSEAEPATNLSQINTPEAVITTGSNALFVQHDPIRNASIVGVLTNGPSGPVTVTNLSGNTSVQLVAGQVVSVADGVIGLIEYFILPMFYESVDLAAGLLPGQQNLISQQSDVVQATLSAVRPSTQVPLNAQLNWLGGLCQQSTIGLQDTLDQVLGLQWLFPSTIPPEQVSINVTTNDLFITPLRSLTGLAWLGEFCLRQPTSSMSDSSTVTPLTNEVSIPKLIPAGLFKDPQTLSK